MVIFLIQYIVVDHSTKPTVSTQQDDKAHLAVNGLREDDVKYFAKDSLQGASQFGESVPSYATSSQLQGFDQLLGH